MAAAFMMSLQEGVCRTPEVHRSAHQQQQRRWRIFRVRKIEFPVKIKDFLICFAKKETVKRKKGFVLFVFFSL
jgi:hypothetical protein